MDANPLKTVKITRDKVYIDGIELPGAIAENGISFTPGGSKGINRLIVEFLVGPLEADDPYSLTAACSCGWRGRHDQLDAHRCEYRTVNGSPADGC